MDSVRKRKKEEQRKSSFADVAQAVCEVKKVKRLSACRLSAVGHSRRASREISISKESNRSNVSELPRISKVHNIPMKDLQHIYKEFLAFTQDAHEFRGWQFPELLAKYLKVDVENLPKHLLADVPNANIISFEQWMLWYKAHEWDPFFISDEAGRHLQVLSNLHWIPLPDVEDILRVFKKFDADGSGQIDYREFVLLLGHLLGVKDPGDLPDGRAHRYWVQLATGNKETCGFDDFLPWYARHFHCGKGMAREGVTPMSHFYASFGVNRFRPMEND